MRRLASRFKFTTVELENVHDWLIAKCLDFKMCIRLFLELKDVTQESAIVLEQNLERAISKSKQLCPSNKLTIYWSLLKLDVKRNVLPQIRYCSKFSSRCGLEHIRGRHPVTLIAKYIAISQQTNAWLKTRIVTLVVLQETSNASVNWNSVASSTLKFVIVNRTTVIALVVPLNLL